MKVEILKSSVTTLASHGLNGWSVDRVATLTGCAKGLVNYHFESKALLLAESAKEIAKLRDRRRLTALSSARGADAIDALWDTVVEDVRSGTFGAWVELAALRRPAAARPDAATGAADLRRELAGALELPAAALPDGLAIAALLDGMSLAILEGSPEEAVQSAYQTTWLALLG